MLNHPEQEYWNCVCLLLPRRKATLIDIEDFERYVSWKWQVLGTSIFCNETIKSNYGTFRTRVERHELSRTILKPPRKLATDHINRNRWDNRRQNLRPVTLQQNAMNRTGVPGTSSQYKGVTRTKNGNWSAQVVFKNKRYHLGTFKSEVEAAMAYNQFILEKCPEHGWLNPITVTPDDEPTTIPKRRSYRGTPVKQVKKRLVPSAPSQKPVRDWSAFHPKPPGGMTLTEYLRRPVDPKEIEEIHARGAARQAAADAKRAERKRHIEIRKAIAPHWQE